MTRIQQKKRWAAPLLGLLVLSASACSDMLEENPLGALSSSNFYRNAQDALTALNGAYQSLHDNGASGYVVARNYVFMLETPTPEVVVYSGVSTVRGCWDVYMCTSTNDEYSQTSWNSIYQAINRANAVITNVPNIQSMDARLRARVVAEAKFLRAFHYFNAVRIWGGVPLRLEETAGLTDLAKPRNTADEVYDQVVKDLTDAIPNLWSAAETPEFGRATKGAAQALLGKVYLHRGVAGKTNPFGSNLYWPTAKATDIQDAITQLRAVMAAPNQYRLVTNYGDLWNEATERNTEVIWSVQNINQSGQGMDASNYLAPNNSGWINSWTSAGAELPFYQSYDPADKRRDVSWLAEYTDQNGRAYRYDPATPRTFTKYPHPTPQLRKYLIERRDVTTNPRDFVVLRYADVLLMLAEAIYHQSGATAEAQSLLNQVRARAGLPAIAPTGAEFREALYQERRKELVQEQHNWFDGQRFWDLFTRELQANGRLGVTNPTAYLRETVPAVVPAIAEPKSRLMPIPQQARDRNKQLVQNPGY